MSSKKIEDLKNPLKIDLANVSELINQLKDCQKQSKDYYDQIEKGKTLLQKSQTEGEQLFKAIKILEQTHDSIEQSMVELGLNPKNSRELYEAKTWFYNAIDGVRETQNALRKFVAQEI
jgi:hypothetical protein